MILYVATHVKSGKKYVGFTAYPLARRIREHLREAEKGSRTAFHCALRKYGACTFVWEQVASCWDTKMMRQAERDLILQEGSFAPGGYNLTPGGDGFSGRHSPESRANIIAALARTRASETTEKRLDRGRAISKAKKGKSQPWAAATGKKSKGTKRSPGFKQSVSLGMKAYCETLPKGEMARRPRKTSPLI